MIPIKQFPPVLTVKEVAELLRVSRSTVYELIKQGELPYFQIGNKKRFQTEQILQWVARREER
ncbi:helix-turn-helix domain-containing protein [Desulforamulus reducens]|uniref:helix-turn-helix domain-containing protein n=1 Tax=Desulforamulus reducens TaxID=59610 RepID=UPI0002F468A8|nr:helix-turn-helix domain-containing protein [Desulforamulus reducens]